MHPLAPKPLAARGRGRIFRALVFGALYPVAYWLIPRRPPCTPRSSPSCEVRATGRSSGTSRASAWTGRNPPRRISASG